MSNQRNPRVLCTAYIYLSNTPALVSGFSNVIICFNDQGNGHNHSRQTLPFCLLPFFTFSSEHQPVKVIQPLDKLYKFDFVMWRRKSVPLARRPLRVGRVFGKDLPLTQRLLQVLIVQIAEKAKFVLGSTGGRSNSKNGNSLAKTTNAATRLNGLGGLGNLLLCMRISSPRRQHSLSSFSPIRNTK